MKGILAVIITCLVVGCATTSPKEADPRLVGDWTGMRDKLTGCQFFSWKLKRHGDGRYVAHFYSDENATKLIAKESGQWWTIDDRYYEKNHSNMKEPDVYTYAVSGNTISYHSLSFDATSDCPGDYQFTDHKVE